MDLVEQVNETVERMRGQVMVYQGSTSWPSIVDCRSCRTQQHRMLFEDSTRDPRYLSLSTGIGLSQQIIMF